MKDHVIRRLPSPAMVVAITALFVALGGTGYAASKLVAPSATAHTAKARKKPANDKGTDTQLVKKLAGGLSVKTAGSATSALTAGHAGSADNATNATNATNAVNATNAASATSAQSATSPGTLGPGQTETGSWAVGATAAGALSFAFGAISFPFPLASAPVPHAVFGPPTAACPGSVSAPSATPGNLCLYVGFSANVSAGVNSCAVTGSTCGRADKQGAAIEIFSASSGNFLENGTWAVTG